MYSPSFSGFPDMTTRLTLHIARRLPGAGSLSGFSYTLTLIFFKVKTVFMLKRTEKNTKSFLPRTLPGQIFFGNPCLRKIFKGSGKLPESGAKTANTGSSWRLTCLKFPSCVCPYSREDSLRFVGI